MELALVDDFTGLARLMTLV